MKLSEYKKINFLYALLLIFALWQAASVLVNKEILPTPLSVIEYIFKNLSKEIMLHISYSFKRILIGLLATVIVGVPVGIVMGYYKKVDSILSPILYFNYPVPKIALLPIVMLFFGLGEMPKFIMIFLITFFPVVVNIRDKVKSISEEIYYPMYSLGASDFQIIYEIVLPATLPVILTSVRIGIGTAISILFFTENFGTEYGMGYYIMDSWMRVSYIQMYSAILILSFIGLMFFIVTDILESFLCPWKDKS
jgi:NitT/TauT family transport system permease protein